MHSILMLLMRKLMPNQRFKSKLMTVLCTVALIPMASVALSGTESLTEPSMDNPVFTGESLQRFGQDINDRSAPGLTQFSDGEVGQFGQWDDLSDKELLSFTGNRLSGFAGRVAKPPNNTPVFTFSDLPVDRISIVDNHFKARPHAELVTKYASQYKLPKALIHAVIKAESNYKDDAISRVGAKGLMQLMDDLSRKFHINPFNADQNIQVGSYYLSKLIDLYDGNVVFALAAYNAGPSRVAKYGGVPPFKETQHYIQTILRELNTIGDT